MAVNWPFKDPDEVLDYNIDWSGRLGTDTIQTSTWFPPSGITDQEEDSTATVTTIWLSGGTVGATYSFLNRIVTVGGRTMDQTVNLKIKQK